jgi:hypothetical protein
MFRNLNISSKLKKKLFSYEKNTYLFAILAIHGPENRGIPQIMRKKHSFVVSNALIGVLFQLSLERNPREK